MRLYCDTEIESVVQSDRTEADAASDMRYFADAADAVCVKNIMLCVKCML